MDQVTQQNAVMVQETTAASRNLMAETEKLSRLLASFKVGANDAMETQSGHEPMRRYA
jgi:methyl-accepting chemotaxis protein